MGRQQEVCCGHSRFAKHSTSFRAEIERLGTDEGPVGWKPARPPWLFGRAVNAALRHRQRVGSEDIYSRRGFPLMTQAV